MPVTTFRPRGHPRFRHQRLGLQQMIETRGVHALLFDPGTGKTLTTVDYMSLLALKSQTGEARVLVIAPLAALDTWVSQPIAGAAEGLDVWAEVLGGSIRQKGEALAARGGNQFPVRGQTQQDRSLGIRRAQFREVLLDGRLAESKSPDLLSDPRLVICAVNFDAFASRRSARGIPGFSTRTMADFMVEAVKRFAPDLIVVDEMHRIKGATSNTSRAIGRLTPLCARRIGLTGTVMPHSPLDVYGQWRFLAPYAFGQPDGQGGTRPATYGWFKNRYAEWGGFMGHDVKRFIRLDEMQEIMGRNATVARKEDVLDLPKVTISTVQVDLSVAEAKAYREMKKGLSTMLASGALAIAPNRLAMLMRLRQITSGYVKDDQGNLVEIGDAKARTIASLVNDTLLGEKRVVVFAHFRPEIAALAEKMAQPGTEVLTITGDTPAEDRRLIRKRFGSDEDTRIVLVAQIRTMSLAVNELVTASHAVFGSLPNQRDDIVQAIARLDRQGQTRPVTIWVTKAPKTVDHVIWNSYTQRTSLEADLLAHIADTT